MPPTLKELANAFSLSSDKAIRQHLVALEKKGYIERIPRKARGIIVKKEVGKEEVIDFKEIIEPIDITKKTNKNEIYRTFGKTPLVEAELEGDPSFEEAFLQEMARESENFPFLYLNDRMNTYVFFNLTLFLRV
jgi:SOS-response transcriptional repressor LexA